MNELKIVFMGTPEFAVPSLQVLIENNFNVVAVVTAPDKPQGRGQKIIPSPVKEFAIKNNIPVLQPEKLKSPGFLRELKLYNANLLVVVAFRMLPEVVWTMPSLGTFNLHASLLPQYRGAAPINWAIINGEKETGVTTFFLKNEIDTGSIIFQEKEPIYDTDSAGSLYQRLMNKGAHLVLKTIKAIQSGNCPSVAQPEDGALKHAPKIFKETCLINWHQKTKSILDFVRGLNPYPTAWTTLQGKTFKIHSVSAMHHEDETASPGAIATDNKMYLYIKTTDGWISIDELQPEGKRRMKPDEFFRGNSL